MELEKVSIDYGPLQRGPFQFVFRNGIKVPTRQQEHRDGSRILHERILAVQSRQRTACNPRDDSTAQDAPTESISRQGRQKAFVALTGGDFDRDPRGFMGALLQGLWSFEGDSWQQLGKSIGWKGPVRSLG